MKKRIPYKKLTPHKVTFETPEEQDCLIEAQFGLSNRSLERKFGFKDGQITYKLAKAKKALGRKEGFRVAWRNGHHPLYERVVADYRAIMRAEIEQDLVPLIVHPTPRTVRIPK